MTPIEQSLTRVEAMSPSNPDVQAIVVALREALKDTARLDWLEQGGYITWWTGNGRKNPHAHTPKTDGASGITVREAIDAAMKDNK